MDERGLVGVAGVGQGIGEDHHPIRDPRLPGVGLYERRSLAKPSRHVRGTACGDAGDGGLQLRLVGDQRRFDEHVHAIVEQDDGQAIAFAKLVDEVAKRLLDRIELTIRSHRARTVYDHGEVERQPLEGRRVDARREADLDEHRGAILDQNRRHAIGGVDAQVLSASKAFQRQVVLIEQPLDRERRWLRNLPLVDLGLRQAVVLRAAWRGAHAA